MLLFLLNECFLIAPSLGLYFRSTADRIRSTDGEDGVTIAQSRPEDEWRSSSIEWGVCVAVRGDKFIRRHGLHAKPARLETAGAHGCGDAENTCRIPETGKPLTEGHGTKGVCKRCSRAAERRRASFAPSGDSPARRSLSVHSPTGLGEVGLCVRFTSAGNASGVQFDEDTSSALRGGWNAASREERRKHR